MCDDNEYIATLLRSSVTSTVRVPGADGLKGRKHRRTGIRARCLANSGAFASRAEGDGVISEETRVAGPERRAGGLVVRVRVRVGAVALYKASKT